VITEIYRERLFTAITRLIRGPARTAAQPSVSRSQCSQWLGPPLPAGEVVMPRYDDPGLRFRSAAATTRAEARGLYGVGSRENFAGSAVQFATVAGQGRHAD